MITLGDILTVFMQTIIVSFGSLFLLFGLLWVEQNAVSHGINMFEVNTQYAGVGALVLVLVNFSVKFWEVHADVSTADQRKRYVPKKQYAFSLKLFFGDVAYWLGIGKRWQKRELPASYAFSTVRKVATNAIMILAFFGRTHEAVMKVSDTGWQDGIKAIAEKSTLADLLVWIGAVIFTFAAVIAAQRVTQYTAIRVIEIRKQFAKNKPVQTAISNRSDGKPMLAYSEARTLSPIKIKVGADTKYKCPQCDKVMSRQAWQKHPCRFTEGYSSIDDAIDNVDQVDTHIDVIDVSTMQPIGQVTTTSVNGHGKRVN